jgi:hypothetical protein
MRLTHRERVITSPGSKDNLHLQIYIYRGSRICSLGTVPGNKRAHGDRMFVSIRNLLLCTLRRRPCHIHFITLCLLVHVTKKAPVLTARAMDMPSCGWNDSGPGTFSMTSVFDGMFTFFFDQSRFTLFTSASVTARSCDPHTGSATCCLEGTCNSM